ncbi:phiSA1p31-related protein [Streptomyces sp. CA-253872]|uniref:phiSA1p31-related protein n=1 Tax=Streptomyces sp. CA-253872 TaxID=3240067 RepID=UPI003D91CD82
MSRPTLQETAVVVADATRAHIDAGCTVCRPLAALNQLCPDGRAVAFAAARALRPAPTPMPRQEQRAEAAGGVREPVSIDARTGEITAMSTDRLAEILVRLSEVPPPPWLLTDDLAGDGYPGHLWAVRTPRSGPHEPDRQTAVISVGDRALGEFIAAARTDVHDLVTEIMRLNEQAERTLAHRCRCFDPTHHARDCSAAVVRWDGRAYPAAVWYQDSDGDWWRPTHVDPRGRLVLLADGDPANDPVPLDDVEDGYGPLTATSHGAHLDLAELPGRPKETPGHRAPCDDFFRVGHTYTAKTQDGDAWEFRADVITKSPKDGRRTALGWRHFRGVWEPYEYPEHAWKILTDGPAPITESA